MTTRRALASAVWLLVVAMDALVIWSLVALGFLESLRKTLPADQGESLAGIVVVAYGAMAAMIAVTLAYATVGFLLIWRPGAGRVGAVLLAGGAAFAAGPFGYVVGGALAMRDPLDPIVSLLFLVGPASIALGYPLILPAVALTFPDGRLPSPRWRWRWATIIALVTASALVVLTPGSIELTRSVNPIGVNGLPRWLSDLAQPLTGVGVILISVLGIIAVVIRFRRGSRLQRQQLRWFLAAVLLAGVPVAMASLPGIGGPGWVLLAAFGLLLVPVSVWIAVTRYRLYEIDRLISRGLTWGALTGMLLAVYAAAILVLQGVLGSVIQGDSLAVAGSTLLVAALFQPVRRRLQNAMDRHFYRARYDGERTAAAFAKRLRSEVDLTGLEADIGRTVSEALRPTSMRVWIRRSGSKARVS